MATPSAISTGASSVEGLNSKLACIIYLLNQILTVPLTNAQIATGAASLEGLNAKLSCIVYLLSQIIGGGGGGLPLTGTVPPTAAASNGQLYINTTDNTLWDYNNGWHQLV